MDQVMVDRLQQPFPLVSRPWEALGQELGCSSAEALRRAQALQTEGILRQLGPIFDTQRLGYSSALVAAQIAPECVERVAEAVSAHPGVSHNYQRAHAFNLWFTLAVPAGRELAAAAGKLLALPGVLKWHLLPEVRRFKLRVQLGGAATSEPSGQAAPKPVSHQDSKVLPGSAPEARGAGHKRSRGPVRPVTELDQKLIRLTQDGLPWVEEPFRMWAESAGLAESELLSWLREMLELGALRRFAAVLHHREAGFPANAMLVWVLPDERLPAAGERLASCPQISHCYQRPTYPDWPYNLFGMCHARSAEELNELADELAAALRALGATDCGRLTSIREFKKVRLRYFVEED